MNLMEAVRKELGKEIKEMLLGIQITKFAFDAEDPDYGDAFIDVLIEELAKLKRKKESPAAKRKAMLSQPMGGKTDEEIRHTRERAVALLTEKGYEVVNTLFTDEWYSKEKMEERGVVQIPLCFLAKSLENMSLCHVAYFCKGWENARGCRIEHEAAKAYGLEILYEEEA